jgi:uncharacterized integral membrane protein (TIGR00697 family)
MQTRAAAAEPPPQRTYQYYDLMLGAFVTVLVCSDMIGASKVVTVGGFTFGAGILFFPLSYIFGDVLTEVYGYARSRRVVWAGFAAVACASLMSAVVVRLPPAAAYPHQAALEAVFGNTPRLVAASLVAYFCGEFVNSFVLAKMKLLTKGRMLWMRTIGSTLAGEAVDSLIFYPAAFLGLWEPALVMRVMVANYVLKCVWEALMTPVTYRAVAFLKRAEHEDFYDWNTNFTPFSLET